MREGVTEADRVTGTRRRRRTAWRRLPARSAVAGPRQPRPRGMAVVPRHTRRSVLSDCRPAGRVAAVLVATALALAATTATASASIRLAFDYPWYPETATVGGQPVHFHPDLMPAWPYDSGDPAVIDRQIASMRYGRIQGA